MDLVGCLRSLLEAQGITVVEDSESGDVESVVLNGPGAETQARINGVGRVGKAKKQDGGGERRRVSFGDARLDETWLSENTRSLAPSPSDSLDQWQQQQQQQQLRTRPAGRRKPLPRAPSGRRARSTSPEHPQRHGRSLRQHATKSYQQQASPSTASTSEPEGDADVNQTLLFGPSQTQLDANAEAFFSTSSIRATRRCLQIWRDTALYLHQNSLQTYAIASAHDRRTLTRQAFDQWRTTFVESREERRIEQYWDHEEKRTWDAYQKTNFQLAFQNWYAATFEQKFLTQSAKIRILQIRYFNRWKALTLENAKKCRIILTRRYLSVWRERLSRKLHRDQQAEAHYEEAITKRCYRAWFWQLLDRNVPHLREFRNKDRYFGVWWERVRGLRDLERKAKQQRDRTLLRRTFDSLRQRFAHCQQDHQRATAHRDRSLKITAFRTLTVHARLNPIAQTLTLKVNLDKQRKAFNKWFLNFHLTRQAAAVDHQRVLLSAWTKWNDALRSRALSQRIDERLVIEALYKWTLAEREALFSRAVNQRVLRQALGWWRYRAVDAQDKLAVAERVFAEQQHRRRLAQSMGHWHGEMRKREDAERSAAEFANARLLPKLLAAWAGQARVCTELNKWAGDATFYTLTTRSLKIWRQRTTQQVHARRRNAYTHVRARVKVRLVGSCFDRWRQESSRVREMEESSEQMAQQRLANVGTQAFDYWQQITAYFKTLDIQAEALNRQKLLSSALSALKAALAQHRLSNQQAETFRHEQELVLLSVVMKKIQWAQFTAARRVESAEALSLRNRDQHVRAMVRHWALKTASRRTARATPAPQGGEDGVEPESPSLRPASRAASRSRERGLSASSPPEKIGSATPSYMRTPSRSRRAGRFRPLPTPVGMTPFAFDTGYLATTPAPLPSARRLPSPQPTDTAEPEAKLEQNEVPGNDPADALPALTPQITPFARKLRAGGFGTAGATPGPSVLRTSVFGRSTQNVGTAKSVRFAGGGRFGSRGGERHEKSS